MKESSTVRMININETVSSVDEIANFYDKLDLMKGKDAKGDTTSHAQVTGTIHIDTISYSDYTALSARYEEIKIDAKHIICTVNFYNEDNLYITQNIEIGHAASVPEMPTKISTQKNYWTFNS